MTWLNWIGLYVILAFAILGLLTACGWFFGEDSESGTDDLED